MLSYSKSKHHRDDTWNSGVYKIINKIDGAFYIGSTVSFRERFNSHVTQLKNLCHHSVATQNAFNKYGIENFHFEIVCRLPPSDLKIVEQWYLDNEYGNYNCCPNANGGSSLSVSKQQCEEIIDLFLTGKYTCKSLSYEIENINYFVIRNIVSGRSYHLYNLDSHKINQCKNILRDNLNRNTYKFGDIAKYNHKLGEEKVAQIKWLIGKRSFRQIGKYFGVDKKVIQQIHNGDSYSHVKSITESNDILDLIPPCKRPSLLVENPFITEQGK